MFVDMIGDMQFFLHIFNRICFELSTLLWTARGCDEHIAPQIIQLGSFIFDANKNIIMKEGVLANTATMETKLIFQGNNLHNKIEEKKEPKKEATVISYSDGLHQRADHQGRS